MKGLTETDLEQLSAAARAATRLRSHRNLHESLDEAVQRLAIAMEPGTQVRAHRHPHTWEIYVALRGSFRVVLFDASGVVTDSFVLGTSLKVYELPANTWHSVVSLESGSVIFEVKQGPYLPPGEADVAPWSPAEGAADVAAFQDFLRRAMPGNRYQGAGGRGAGK